MSLVDAFSLPYAYFHTPSLDSNKKHGLFALTTTIYVALFNGT